MNLHNMALPNSKNELKSLCRLILVVIVLVLPDLSAALSNVTINVPRAVKRGGNATLSCTYDLEWGNLYSVKWYKGKYEFYRYMPSGSPNIKVFILGNLRVDTSVSNQTHLLLLDMQPEMSGKYTCEISMDAPDFTTAMISGELGVVELPKETAIVTGIQSRYRIGDLVDGNCSIKFSKPAANLTWTINGIVVPPHHIKTYQIEKHENGSLESVMSALNFMVTTQHFNKGQMLLKCTASIYNIFKEEIENVIEEDRPRIMASGQSYDMHNYPYEQQHTNGDGFEDHNESYLTYYSAADTTSGATRTFTPFAVKCWKKYFQRISFVLQIIVKKTHELAAGFTPLTTTSSPISTAKATVKARSSAAVKTASHLSTRWTVLLRTLQQSNNEQQYNENDILNILNVHGNREKVVPEAGFNILSIASCYVTLTIILTHHFMSCQNTKTAKTATVAPTARTTEIVPSNIRMSATKRTSAVTVTPSSIRSNKSFYNCPESVKANESKARKLLFHKWQTSMEQWQQCQRQQSDCQCDDSIYDDCQQEQQQRGNPHQRERKAHSQVSKRRVLRIFVASTKSIENYISNGYIAASDAFLSLSKDQILLMTFPSYPASIFLRFTTFPISFNTVITKTVSKQVTNACEFFQRSIQTLLHHNRRRQYANC